MNECIQGFLSFAVLEMACDIDLKGNYVHGDEV